jgi:hypothetical protein
MQRFGTGLVSHLTTRHVICSKCGMTWEERFVGVGAAVGGEIKPICPPCLPAPLTVEALIEAEVAKAMSVLGAPRSSPQSGTRVPTNHDYAVAVGQALRAAGIAESDVRVILRLARQQRLAFGFFDDNDVPRVPLLNCNGAIYHASADARRPPCRCHPSGLDRARNLTGLAAPKRIVYSDSPTHSSRDGTRRCR